MIITNENNIDLMKRYPDRYFDIAIVDPPYAVGASNGVFGRGGNKAKNRRIKTELHHYSNHNEVPDEIYFDELYRVSKNQIIWGANYYPEYLNHSGWIVWDKMKSDGLLSEAELAYQSFDKVVKIFKHEWEGFRKGKGSFEGTAKSIIHPNQKPVKLYKWCLDKYAKEGDKILDTHLGSGSSAIAAHYANIAFVGLEINSTCFEAMEKRFKNETSQTVLTF